MGSSDTEPPLPAQAPIYGASRRDHAADLAAELLFQGRPPGHELKPHAIIDHGEATGRERDPLPVDARVLVQIDRKTRLANMAVRRCLLYRAASTAFQTAGALRSLTHSLPMLNCPLWIRRNSSMPAIVIAAVLNHLNPSIGSMRSFTPR